MKSVTAFRFSLALLPTLLTTSFLSAQGEKTELVKTKDGWQMKVNGQPFYVKGFTWSYAPVGTKYDYNLFGEKDSAIKAALKRDMTLIRDAGGNTVRHIYPPKWMRYIHENYGIHFIANDYCGRYGLTIDGKFIAHTDYSDPKTRRFIKSTWRKLARKYRNTPGLIAHALGNENNYGLEWKSAAVENLPEGERQTAKAKYLYSLYNEIALEIKKIDPHHPVGIVNGDLQYLDLIKELCPDIDYLGVNAYRGKTYSDLFERVKKTLNKPVLLMETGCDAFHAVLQREDEVSQARMIFDNWIDIYKNTAKNGGSGNSIGALCFQWADEWWKHGQEYGLDIHNTEGSWHHGQYYHDAKAPKNMNEEWFGVCAIYRETVNGAHIIRPRAAYFTLKELWKVNPLTLGSSDLGKIRFREELVTKQAEEATQALPEKLKKAKVPEAPTPTAELPAFIYRNADHPLTLWHPSGVMPEKNFLKLNPNHMLNPHSGSSCLEIRYLSGGDWSGLQWQHPANDWHNNHPGGYDLSGAKQLKFWARGHKGGEKFTLTFGGPLSGRYPNTAEAKLGDVTLTKTWKLYAFPLTGKNLRRVKNPMTIILKGTGFPFRFYLDDIVIE